MARIATDPSGPLARACASPLTLSLLSNVYGENGDPAELLDTERFGTAKLIQGHLLARTFNRAYPEERGWAAKREWLRWLAVNMGQDRNLRWWQIPSWTPVWRQRTVISLLAGLLVGGALGMVISPLGAVIGAALGIVRAGFLGAMKEPVVRWAPRRPAARELRIALTFAFFQAACTLALAYFIDFWIACCGAVLFAILNAAVYLITHVWVTGIRDGDDLSPLRSQATSSMGYRLAGITFGLSLAASNGLWGWAGYSWLAKAHALPGGGGVAVALGLAFGLTIGIAGGMPMILVPSLGMCQLFFTLTGRPVNFTALLREAHMLKILRQVGSVYQFASAELQDEIRKSDSAIS